MELTEYCNRRIQPYIFEGGINFLPDLYEEYIFPPLQQELSDLEIAIKTED